MIVNSKTEHLSKIHSNRSEWMRTPEGESRGYIQPQSLQELWFHTGTVCNLSCPFCLEGSKPGDNRLNKITFEDAKPFIDEAIKLGVQKFSFTGGEPFVIKDLIKILSYVLERRPCLVLTNATVPLKARISDLDPLLEKPNTLNFRVSFDYPVAQRHDEGRGEGNFNLSWEMIAALHKLGFQVSIARQRESGEDGAAVDEAYRRHFENQQLPSDTRIISFPDFLTPGSLSNVPVITEHCMTQYHDEESRNNFMCNYSKMIVKKDGRMRVYACTLVDDDVDYDLGGSLTETQSVRVMLKHHRCYSCFAQSASCSER